MKNWEAQSIFRTFYLDKNKAEHAVQSYAAGVRGQGAWVPGGCGPGARGYIYNILMIYL